jgi:hypothetical protein
VNSPKVSVYKPSPVVRAEKTLEEVSQVAYNIEQITDPKRKPKQSISTNQSSVSNTNETLHEPIDKTL